MTEARRNEERLRALTNRVVQVQEAERGRVALELHDTITQMLCAILVRCQTLANELSASDGPAKREAIKLRELLGHAAEEVERISRNLRPSVLEDLGLVAVIGETGRKFTERTGVALKLACDALTVRLPADAELALYRILQEALKNAEKHARARQVTVCLRRQGDFIQLIIRDDGIGFDPAHLPAGRKGKGGLGLIGSCASGRPMSGASSRSNPRAVPARKSRRVCPCHQVPRRLPDGNKRDCRCCDVFRQRQRTGALQKLAQHLRIHDPREASWTAAACPAVALAKGDPLPLSEPQVDTTMNSGEHWLAPLWAADKAGA